MRIALSRRHALSDLAQCVYALRLSAGVCLLVCGRVEAAVVACARKSWRSSACHLVLDGARFRARPAVRLRQPAQSLATYSQRRRSAFSSPTCELIIANVARCCEKFAMPIRMSSCLSSSPVSVAQRVRPFAADRRRTRTAAGLALEHPGGNSVNVFSKLPLKSDTREWFAGRCVEIVEIPVGSQTLRLVGLHAPRPMEFRDNDYERLLEPCRPAAARQAKGRWSSSATSMPRNTRSCISSLKAGGLRSAHEDRGRGYATTWPNGEYLAAADSHRSSVSVARGRVPRHFGGRGAWDRTTSR